MRGSVFKRCQEHGVTGTRSKRACKKPHGSWYYRIDADASSGSKRRQPAKGGFKTQEAAQEALDRYVQGGRTDDAGMTLTEWLRQWLTEGDPAGEYGWAVSTHQQRTEVVEGVLIPMLGEKRLRDLRRRDVEAALRKLRTAPPPPPAAHAGPRPKLICGDDGGVNAKGEPCGRYAVFGGTRCPNHGGGKSTRPPARRRGGVRVVNPSPSTLDGWRRVGRAALSVAERRELIPAGSNPFAGTMDAIPTIGQPEHDHWEIEEVARFLLHIVETGDPDVEAFMIDAWSGLRRGELLGLPILGVDLEDKFPGMDIAQTVIAVTGEHDCPECGQQHRGKVLQRPSGWRPGTKTAAGTRWVPLASPALAVIEQQLVKLERRRNDLGAAWKEHGLLLPGADGAPRQPKSLTQRFKEVSAAAGNPIINLHEMRGGACGLLLAAGAPIEEVSMILGHANVDVTRKWYRRMMRASVTKHMTAAVELVRSFEAPTMEALESLLRAQAG